MKLIISLVILSLAAAGATIDTVVDAKTMPWLSVNGGLNTGFQFGTGDGGGPDILNTNEGGKLASGNVVSVKYLSGLVSTCDACPYVDANGWTDSTPNSDVGDSRKLSPSAYVPGHPIYLMALVGVFANDGGAIIGSPFFVGDGPRDFVVPVGATSLQLGVNDNSFRDNSGLFRIQVSYPETTDAPEPSALALLGLGILASVVARWNRKTRRLDIADATVAPRTLGHNFHFWH